MPDMDGLDLLAEVATPQQLNRFTTDGVLALSKDERHELAVRLMEGRNKVTHIYELVKATGSGGQVIYNRTDRVWHRREGIAAKHNQEVSVNPFTGLKTIDDSDAPFIYAEDPRTDVPGELQERLVQRLGDSDDVIVSGWLGDGSDDDS